MGGEQLLWRRPPHVLDPLMVEHVSWFCFLFFFALLTWTTLGRQTAQSFSSKPMPILTWIFGGAFWNSGQPMTLCLHSFNLASLSRSQPGFQSGKDINPITL